MNNKTETNKTYSITEGSDTYEVENLIAETEGGMLFFYDKNDYILKNRKILVCTFLKDINEININDHLIRITLTNKKEVNIAF